MYPGVLYVDDTLAMAAGHIVRVGALVKTGWASVSSRARSTAKGAGGGNNRAWTARRDRMMTYDARHHHVGTRLSIGTRDVVMIHGTAGGVWNLWLKVDAIAGRGSVLVVSERLRHRAGCADEEAWRWLPCKLYCLVRRRVRVVAVGVCGIVVDEDMVDAGGC